MAIVVKYDNSYGFRAFTTGSSEALVIVTGSVIAREVVASRGISGSLHRLADGSPAFVAGSNVTITSSSNGPITISATGGGSGGAVPGDANVVDLRTPGMTTATAAPLGGVVSGTITQWFNIGTTAFVKVVQSGTAPGTDIEFYSSSSFAPSALLYQAIDKDLTTSPHIDATPWFYVDDETSESIYYRILNKSTAPASYTIQLVGIGRQSTGGDATVVDSRSPGTTTATAAPFGGVVSGSIAWHSLGMATLLEVAQSGSSLSTNIEFYASSSYDVSRRLYNAVDRDLSAASHRDGTPWFTEDDDSSNKIYYRITNNGNVPASYTITLVGIGRVIQLGT